MQTIKDQTFQSEVVTVDDKQFFRCNFNSCTLVYSGGLVGFDNCNLSTDTRWEFKDAATRTLGLLKMLGMLREGPYQGYVNPTEKRN